MVAADLRFFLFRFSFRTVDLFAESH